MNRYVKELSDYLGEFATRCRAAHWLGALFHVRVCADILEDIVSTFSAIRGKAHKAETNVREAMRLMDDAKLPASPGGAAITPEEEKPIHRLLERGAEHAHDISEIATA